MVLDCRWLGIGGPGRTTELVLRGMAQGPPAGRWILWGAEAATRAIAWPGADIRPIATDPRIWLGQRHAFDVPKGDFHVFMHQQRPLRRLPAVTLIYDTIALRYGSSRPGRQLKGAFMRAVARTSHRILTISEHSRAGIERDLGVPAGRIEVLRFPFDDAFVARVHEARRAAEPVDAALFVGGFLPHKNLPRLLPAFAATAFCRDGGRLILVAGTPGQAAAMFDGLDAHQREFVDIRHSCSQAEMDGLFATCLFLVQPSLEEGFGLPAWEAICCGLPICVSDGGSLPEVTSGFADPFPARSVPAMIEALDACADAARRPDDAARARRVASLRERAPTVEAFGSQFRAAVAGCAAATT